LTRLAEPGIGAWSQLQASLILHCPANPTAQVVDIAAVHRFFTRIADVTKAVQLRADAKAVGGQLPSGDSLIELHCFIANGPTLDLSKLENASGGTVNGNTSGTAAACDPAFGPVPGLSNNATDFNFSAPISFPGQW